MILEQLVAAAERIRETVGRAHPGLALREIVGIGWATVELERAALELSFACADWEPAPRDPLLGARVWRCRDDGTVVLLEPDTEGRLAASLARYGEGLAAIYLERGTDLAEDPIAISPPATGPLGPSRLVLGGPPHGPHLVLVERGAP